MAPPLFFLFIYFFWVVYIWAHSRKIRSFVLLQASRRKRAAIYEEDYDDAPRTVIVGPEKVEYTVEGFRPGTLYEAKISVFNNQMDGVPSEAITFRTEEGGLPFSKSKYFCGFAVCKCCIVLLKLQFLHKSGILKHFQRTVVKLMKGVLLLYGGVSQGVHTGRFWSIWLKPVGLRVTTG